MGLHQDGNKDRDRHKLSLNSAGAMFGSPHRIAADDHQYCSTPTRGDYARLGLVRTPSRWSATIFMLAFRCAKFWHFDIFDSQPQGELSTNINPFLWHTDTCRRLIRPIWCTGACIHKVFIHYRRYIAVARIWTFGERKLGKSLESWGTAWELANVMECGQRTFWLVR